MNIETARGLAAQCWCDPRMGAIDIDPILAEVVADMFVAVTELYTSHEFEDQFTDPCESHSPEYVALYRAATALYMAGHWTLPAGSGWDQAKLWEDLRSLLGFTSEHSIKAGEKMLVIDPNPEEEPVSDFELVVKMATALYMAGRWALPEDHFIPPSFQDIMWENLRGALGFASEHSTEAGVNPRMAEPETTIIVKQLEEIIFLLGEIAENTEVL